MPTITDTEVDGYAHCPDSRCPGNRQERIKAIRREISRTYREMGGDAPGVEASWVHFHPVNTEDLACPHCGRSRDMAGQARVEYDPMSGYDPMGLLGVPQFTADKQAELRAQPLSDPEREHLEKQNAELLARLERLEAKEPGLA